MKRLSVLSLLVVFALVLAACAPAAAPAPAEPAPAEPAAPPAEPTPEPPAPPMTLVDVAAEAGNFTTLLAAAEAAGLVDVLKSEGPFTVFAPTDEAFAKLPAGTIEALLADPETLKTILLYHVVPGKVMASDAVQLSSAVSAAELPFLISLDGAEVMINGAKVLATDIMADNGVIHVIDSVILPPVNLVETAASAGSFTTLLAAAEAAGLVETLTSGGPFTVFAPSDEAFAALPEGTVEALLADPEALKSILLYHVVEGLVPSAEVGKLESAKTVNGKPVVFTVDMGKVMVNDAQVVAADVLAANGIVHVIDKVLLPPNNIVEAAVADGRFTTLVAAVQAAELAEALQADGPFTVFAPTDDAFKKLPAGTVESLLKDTETLKSILLYHVVEGKVMAEDVVELSSAKTLNGADVTIKVEDGKVFINEAQVIITDIVVSNGVIHVLDSVILPPS